MSDLLDSKSVSEKFEQDILRQINSGMLKHGDRLMPERELCLKYSLSRGATRKVLSRLAQQGWLKRRGRYGTTVNIARKISPVVIYSYLSSFQISDVNLPPHSRKIYRGMEKEALSLNWDTMIQIDEAFRRKLLTKDTTSSNWADGIILGGTEMGEAIAGLQKKAIPFVAVDYPSTEQGINSVCADNIGGGYIATAHLLKLGHRKIGCLYPVFSGETVMQPCFKGRYLGYISSVSESGHGIDQTLTRGVEVSSDFLLTPNGEKALRGFLARPDRPSAVFVVSDCICHEFYRVAKEMKLRIPEDISITGFEGIPMKKEFNPSLTTICVDWGLMGQTAVKRLNAILSGDTSPVKQIIPVELAVKNSTMRKIREK